MKKHIVSLTYPAESRFISKIRQSITGFCKQNGLSNEHCHSLALAADEACSNIIKHAYKKVGRNEMQISFWREENVIYIVAEDAGCGFDHRQVVTPSIDQNEPIESGYGILLMKNLVDEVRFSECSGGGLSVMLIKEIH